MQSPLVDLPAAYQAIRHEITDAFDAVLEHMQLFLGPQREMFKHVFASYCGCQYGVGVSSGTDVLALSLRACGIGPGDEVITEVNTFIATAEAIALVGATSVFVDIDMQPVLSFARVHNFRLIMDASQAHGAIYQGKRVGSFGDIGCFCPYYSKNLRAYGEAGIYVTNDDALAVAIRLVRDHGSPMPYRHEVLGVNSRFDELQTAMVRIKLRYPDQLNEARQGHAQADNEQLQGVVKAPPVVRPGGTHV